MKENNNNNKKRRGRRKADEGGVPLNLGKVDLKSGSAVTPGQVASVGVPANPMTPHLNAAHAQTKIHTHTHSRTQSNKAKHKGADQGQH